MMGQNNFSGQKLRGRSFKNLDLSGADFSGCDLRGVDFSGANLTGAKFCRARMGKAMKSKVISFFPSVLMVFVAVFFGMMTNAFYIMVFFEALKKYILIDGNHIGIGIVVTLLPTMLISFAILKAVQRHHFYYLLWLWIAVIILLDHQVFNIRQYCFPPVIQQPYTLVKGWVPYAPNPCRRDAFR
ncbi:MAG: pentapeptide repeat-containing protein, partial [Methylovulum sp.]|nr:pentapeptide repeat-containing protein [Methylovulum sp.]